MGHSSLPILPKVLAMLAVHPAEASVHTLISAPEGRLSGGNIMVMLSTGMNGYWKAIKL